MVELILNIILNKPLAKKLTPLEVFQSTDYRKGWVYPGNREDEASDGKS